MLSSASSVTLGIELLLADNSGLSAWLPREPAGDHITTNDPDSRHQHKY